MDIKGRRVGGQLAGPRSRAMGRKGGSLGGSPKEGLKAEIKRTRKGNEHKNIFN